MSAYTGLKYKGLCSWPGAYFLIILCQKTQPSEKHRFWKNQEKLTKIGKNTFKKKSQFSFRLSVFIFFFENGALQRASVFCIAFSVARRLIWAIKINYRTDFDFGGSKVSQHGKKVKKFKTKKLNQGAKWNTKIGGRSCVITCGAFKDTLVHWWTGISWSW